MASKLRIAVWYNLTSGGAKRALSDHLRGLKARGHEIVAWRPPIPQEDYLRISDVVEERVVPLDPPPVPDRTYFDRLRKIPHYEAGMRDAMRRHSETVAREIDAGGFDVLFANTCRHYHSPWLGRYAKTPKLLYLQEPRRHFYEATPRLPWLALPEEEHRGWSPSAVRGRLKHLSVRVRDELDVRAYRRQAADELENARSYGRILVNSNYSREAVLRAYALDSEVCYLGVDTERLATQNLPREPFVLSVGSFFDVKDPEFIVRSIATIPTDRPRLVWVANMANEGYLERVRALAKELGVDLDVRQYIPDAELTTLLNQAAVFAYAPRLEPFGYAPLEANACGTPVVAVSEGGVKESIVNGLNGVVVPHRPEAMGAAIADLLANPVEARAMGERAVTHVRERWSLARAADDLERNLSEIAQKGAGS